MTDKPIPVPTPEALPFWEAARRHELWIQRCRTTGRAFFYPRTYSPYVTGGDVEWFRASGRGRLYSFIIDHRPPPGFPVPNPIAVVELDEGPRMMTTIVGVEPTPENLVLDMDLEVDFEERGDWSVPVFRPAGSAASSDVESGEGR
jgi:uncharacterized protein